MEGNLDVNQGAGMECSVAIRWEEASGLTAELWRVRTEAVTHYQVYIPWTQDGGGLNLEVKGLLHL